jgi:hypothetical protein
VEEAAPDAASADDESPIGRPPYHDTGVPTFASAADGAGSDGSPLSSRSATTDSILASRGSDCLWCVMQNGCLDPNQLGGTCEDAQKFGFGCGFVANQDGGAGDGGMIYYAPSSPKGVIKCYSDICTKTLEDIFSSNCTAMMGQFTQCVCGTTDNASCLAGMAAPTGPVVPDFEIDYGLTAGSINEAVVIQQDLIAPTHGAVQAVDVVQCAVSFGCDSCFSATPDDGGGAAASDGGEITQAILSAQGSDCLSCAQSTGCLDPQLGGACEDTPGTAMLNGANCADIFGSDAATPSETDVCLVTLRHIFGAGCDSTPSALPSCLCVPAPNTTPPVCSQDPNDPVGPLWNLYTCAFNGDWQTKFVDRSLGAGRANALVQCLGANGCNCFRTPEAGAPNAGSDSGH